MLFRRVIVVSLVLISGLALNIIDFSLLVEKNEVLRQERNEVKVAKNATADSPSTTTAHEVLRQERNEVKDAKKATLGSPSTTTAHEVLRQERNGVKVAKNATSDSPSTTTAHEVLRQERNGVKVTKTATSDSPSTTTAHEVLWQERNEVKVAKNATLGPPSTTTAHEVLRQERNEVKVAQNATSGPPSTTTAHEVLRQERNEIKVAKNATADSPSTTTAHEVLWQERNEVKVAQNATPGSPSTTTAHEVLRQERNEVKVAQNATSGPPSTTTAHEVLRQERNEVKVAQNATSDSPSTMRAREVLRQERNEVKVAQNATSGSPSTTTAHDDLHFCTMPEVTLGPTRSIVIHYQCAGPLYEDFADRLHDFARNRSSNPKQLAWGRRPFPLPANKTLLVIGNSHTRQMLLCQYHTLIDRIDENNEYTRTLYLSHNVTIVTIFNCPYVYSQKWETLIGAVLGHSFQSLDAIVLGMFNRIRMTPDTPINSFKLHMLNYSKEHPGDIDVRKTDPPTPTAFAEVFSGPIIAVSMFAMYSQHDSSSSFLHTIDLYEKQNRTNILFLNGRHYMPALGECGSDEHYRAGTCNDPGLTNTTRNPADMHRCTGPRGGHPDLLAWDTMEALHKLLK